MLFVKIKNYTDCDFFSDTIALAVVGKITRCVTKQKKNCSFEQFSFFGCSNNLSSRTVASQVLSALVSLTSVFGMRTGGTSPLTSPQWYISDFSVNIDFRVYLVYTLFRQPSIFLHGRFTTA